MSHHDHLAHEGQNFSKKTLSGYVIGIVLAFILTVLAFAVVDKQLLTGSLFYVVLAGLAIVQFFVQSICFLGLNYSKEGQWNLLPYIFAILVIAILVGGTLWIMYNMNYNMMPMMS